MGLFDEIRCEAPLPDGDEVAGQWFQSKSFPHPSLERYTISINGRLLDDAGNDLEPDGYVLFYTIDREEPLREYRARFVEGQLRDIVRVRPDQEDRVYYGLASIRWFARPTPSPPTTAAGPPSAA